METRDYRNIPGTYVFDGKHLQEGYGLNMFCKSLDEAVNRAEFKSNPAMYLDQFAMTQRQKEAVLNREWLELLRLGGNIYYTFKLAIFDGLTMQHVGAAMSGSGMTVDQFKQMMSQGGRSIEGNRRRGDQHG
ncbi:protocatechuate 4,5-dioxygenase subunit alpha [Rhodoferax ferrireducens]|uniref:protocatechuate 4,5-dioxygenase subunit alpha n=1 Tax=Rhodoferax ferrireducens TaxID=192843 RepID=UPI000E0CF0B3|nr:protocatechuate 4,5-dioxygenase subunit alpha [Rhodoferax ferrireducens]